MEGHGSGGVVGGVGWWSLALFVYGTFGGVAVELFIDGTIGLSAKWHQFPWPTNTMIRRSGIYSPALMCPTLSQTKEAEKQEKNVLQ